MAESFKNMFNEQFFIKFIEDLKLVVYDFGGKIRVANNG